MRAEALARLARHVGGEALEDDVRGLVAERDVPLAELYAAHERAAVAIAARLDAVA